MMLQRSTACRAVPSEIWTGGFLAVSRLAFQGQVLEVHCRHFSGAVQSRQRQRAALSQFDVRGVVSGQAQALGKIDYRKQA